MIETGEILNEWLEHHTASERLAANADVAARRDDLARATELYGAAADAEYKAMRNFHAQKCRTIGVLAVSTVALYAKARRFETCEAIGREALERSDLPVFARQQIEKILKSV